MSQPPKPRGLGRGLSALLGDDEVAATVAPAPAAAPSAEAPAPAARPLPVRAPLTLPIGQLKAGRMQPRTTFEDMEALVDSVKEFGLLQPILVRPVAGQADAYEIVAGERRWRAAQRANLHEVPVVVRALTDREAVEIAIIENVQREDLNAIEEGEGYKLLMDGHDYTQEDVAKVIGKSRSHLANTLRLLRLPEAVQELVREGALSAGHARALVGRPDAAALALRIVNEGLTVREIEALTQGKAPAKSKPKKGKSSDLKAAEAELHEALGLAVEIRKGKGEKGELRIRYTSLDQFEDLRRRLLRHPR